MIRKFWIHKLLIIFFILLFCNSKGLDYTKSHLKNQPTVHSNDTSPSSDEDDFFSNIKKGNAHEDTKQLESYLASPANTTDTLKSYPAVCHLSLKLNTPLPQLLARGFFALRD